MNINIDLVKNAYTLDQLPVFNSPQIALAGRSNVGKSSLINALAGRKKLAKTSSNPGKTRSVNFYLVKPWDFYLVDLPGYGYARASHDERRSWAKVLEKYLGDNGELKSLALLLDCRLPPQQLDINLADYAMEIKLPVLPILTKVDKCSQHDRQTRQNEWQAIIGRKPLLVSAQKRTGLDKLWRALVLAATGNPIGSENGE